MAKNSYLPFNGLRGKPLTVREITVLRLYSHETSVAEIAERLFLSEAAVRKDIQTIIYKLGTCNVTCALEKAHKLHLL